jgi:hypothetical protein
MVSKDIKHNKPVTNRDPSVAAITLLTPTAPLSQPKYNN